MLVDDTNSVVPRRYPPPLEGKNTPEVKVGSEGSTKFSPVNRTEFPGAPRRASAGELGEGMARPNPVTLGET
jgi:hypothetical protein